MARVFSGIKPTGDMQLGNYVGAVRRWVAQQHDDAIYCVVDLHAMTVPYDAADLRAATHRMATMLLAAGIDPDHSLLFVQSHVPQHTELTWILNSVASFGELRRMTQFKDKSTTPRSGGQDSVTAGLFDYPVLMAADILLYDTDEVPIGDDQRQHLELSRDLALRFNHRFGETFVVPKGTFPPIGARVMDLQDPTSKMSKSTESPQGTVLVLDDPKTITKKIKSAVTDSGSDVRYDPDEKPGVSNLIEILAAVTDRPIPEVESQFAGTGYGAFKGAVAEAVVEALRPVRERYDLLTSDPAEVDRALARGARRAEAIAAPVMGRVRERGRAPRTHVTASPPGRPRWARSGDGLEFDRLTFFNDAVFAIAMTLLIVAIAVPNLRDTSDGRVLLDALSDKLPEFVAFFIGFAVLGNYWIANHRFTSHLREIEPLFVLSVPVAFLSPVVAIVMWFGAVPGEVVLARWEPPEFDAYFS